MHFTIHSVARTIYTGPPDRVALFERQSAGRLVCCFVSLPCTAGPRDCRIWCTSRQSENRSCWLYSFQLVMSQVNEHQLISPANLWITPPPAIDRPAQFLSPTSKFAPHLHLGLKPIHLKCLSLSFFYSYWPLAFISGAMSEPAPLQTSFWCTACNLSSGRGFIQEEQGCFATEPFNRLGWRYSD